MSTSDIQQAREWAENGAVKVNSGEVIDEIAKAAVRVIQSLPDQWLDAEKVRVLIASLNAWAEDADAERAHGRALGYRTAAKNLAVLLPAPSLPTLADMTPEDREACQWMQAQTWHEVGIILWVDEDTEIAHLITRVNGVLERKFKDVTPLPDLPKLEWPGGGVEDAPVAEKQAHAELRKRIEERIRELKQPLCSHIPVGDELDDYLEQWDRQSYEAAALARILEADNG